MQKVVFGGEKHERLEIAVIGYAYKKSGNYYDDNWLTVEISLHVGSFKGAFQAAFLTTELEKFRDELTALHATNKGQAEFHTLEGQLSLTLIGDGLGHIEIKGEALDQAGIGNRLSFVILIDQTQLESSARSLGAAISVYPVRT